MALTQAIAMKPDAIFVHGAIRRCFRDALLLLAPFIAYKIQYRTVPARINVDVTAPR